MTASAEKERAEFEAFAQSQWRGINLAWMINFSKYADFDTNTKWITWQAARRTQVVPMTLEQAQQSMRSATSQMPPLPWQYRPDKYDDWGCIKDADGRVICYARDTTVLDEATLTKHRAAGTDPWREVAMFIANACNAAMDKRAALSAGPGIQKAVQALIDAAILEGGSPPPSQEAAMQATEQRKADLLKLLEPFIGTPLNE